VLSRLLVAGRKGASYQQALAVLVLFAALAGVHTEPLGWSWSDGTLDALLMALAGILSAFVVGNGAEHVAKRGQAAAAPSPEGG
jgi:Ca2+/H+ antiporter